MTLRKGLYECNITECLEISLFETVQPKSVISFPFYNLWEDHGGFRASHVKTGKIDPDSD